MAEGASAKDAAMKGDKMIGIAVGKGFKLVGTRLVRDHAATEAKLDLCARLRRRNSKKSKPVSPAKAHSVKVSRV